MLEVSKGGTAQSLGHCMGWALSWPAGLISIFWGSQKHLPRPLCPEGGPVCRCCACVLLNRAGVPPMHLQPSVSMPWLPAFSPEFISPAAQSTMRLRKNKKKQRGGDFKRGASQRETRNEILHALVKVSRSSRVKTCKLEDFNQQPELLI